jgi:hypothetical protein
MTELERARQAIDLLVISLRLRGRYETATALEKYETNLKAELEKAKPKRKRVK